MKITYDPEADALYIQFSNKPLSHSVDIEEGIVYDVDKEGNFAGIEILDAKKRFKSTFNKVEFIHYPLPAKRKAKKRSKKKEAARD